MKARDAVICRLMSSIVFDRRTTSARSASYFSVAAANARTMLGWGGLRAATGLLKVGNLLRKYFGKSPGILKIF